MSHRAMTVVQTRVLGHIAQTHIEVDEISVVAESDFCAVGVVVVGGGLRICGITRSGIEVVGIDAVEQLCWIYLSLHSFATQLI